MATIIDYTMSPVLASPQLSIEEHEDLAVSSIQVVLEIRRHREQYRYTERPYKFYTKAINGIIEMATIMRAEGFHLGVAPYELIFDNRHLRQQLALQPNIRMPNLIPLLIRFNDLCGNLAKRYEFEATLQFRALRDHARDDVHELAAY